MTLILRKDEFDFIAAFLKERSGLALTPDKTYLIETRLQPVARSHNLKDIGELIATIKAGKADRALITDITEAMTTNESMFFRDTKPFEYLNTLIIPALKQAGRSHARIWSAACSTGQEPYSMAMTLNEHHAGFGFEIIATDLNEKVLERARSGQFTQFEVQRGLPITLLMKYFHQRPGNMWEVDDTLKTNIRFQKLNLLESYLSLGKFDIIFCRNVLIYFDDSGKTLVLGKLAEVLNPSGFLMLGAAETILNLSNRYTSDNAHRGLYKLA